MSRKADKIGTLSLAGIIQSELSRICSSLLGSLLFCPDCGTLLNLPQDGEFEVTCEQCGHVEPASCSFSFPIQFL